MKRSKVERACNAFARLEWKIAKRLSVEKGEPTFSQRAEYHALRRRYGFTPANYQVALELSR